MTKRKLFPRTLNAKMFYMSLLGLAVGIGVYFLALVLSVAAIDNIYMSSERVAMRKAEIHANFSAYVSNNVISGKDTAAVARWTKDHDGVTIVIFSDDSSNIHFANGKTVAVDSADYDPAQFGKLYLVNFSDRLYRIAIIDNSQQHQYQLSEIASLIFGCFGFIMVSLLYSKRLTKRIIALSKEAALVSSGDLERSITPSGDDEIAALGSSMDEMRRSVIERIGNESRAWQANTQLITAISHDIRTPMTSMIGYLGLLSESDFEDKERCRQFADSAYSKAMELKYLTDELFRYFLVFGKAELTLDMERLDGRLLLEQLIGEAAFDLEDSGFKINRIDFKGECMIDADPMYLMRVINNLVSNVKKYSDPDKLVMFISELKDGRLSLCVSNYIAPNLDKKESTKIGLMTCQKIMDSMNGSFETRADDEHFAAELSLPAHAISE